MQKITITMTDDQAATLRSLSDPYIPARSHDASDGVLHAYEVIDDNHVRLYSIQPDGDFTYESLEDGFNYGWSTFDSNDKPLRSWEID